MTQFFLKLKLKQCYSPKDATLEAGEAAAETPTKEHKSNAFCELQWLLWRGSGDTASQKSAEKKSKVSPSFDFWNPNQLLVFFTIRVDVFEYFVFFFFQESIASKEGKTQYFLNNAGVVVCRKASSHTDIEKGIYFISDLFFLINFTGTSFREGVRLHRFWYNVHLDKFNYFYSTFYGLAQFKFFIN